MNGQLTLLCDETYPDDGHLEQQRLGLDRPEGTGASTLPGGRSRASGREMRAEALRERQPDHGGRGQQCRKRREEDEGIKKSACEAGRSGF